MPRYLNKDKIPLPLAVLLATDFYDLSDDPKTISATALLKPVKRIILASRLKGTAEEDISSKIASTNGTAIHEQMEQAWLKNYEQAMLDLGYDQKIVDKMCINPTAEGLAAFREQFKTEPIPVYLERRTEKPLAGWTISGAFDFVIEDKVYDLKTTGVYSYIHGSNEDDYIKQMSIYRWLNPTIISKDIGSILYWFTDWSSLKASIDKAYPPTRILAKDFDLLSLKDTEEFITKKLYLIDHLIEADEAVIPACSDIELWSSSPTWKYYKNPASTKRSTKNFTNPFDAATRLATDGNVGKVVEHKSQARACGYCPALPICRQARQLIAEGRLVV